MKNLSFVKCVLALSLVVGLPFSAYSDCKAPKRGPPGPPGPPGPAGPAFSTSNASFYTLLTGGSSITIPAGANVPFEAEFYPSQGITYDNINNNFIFSQTGLYLVSYGVNTRDVVAVALAYNNGPDPGTVITGSQIAISNDSETPHPNLFNSTVIIPITDVSQTLSLMNSGENSFDLFVEVGPGQAAYITITRVADLP